MHDPLTVAFEIKSPFKNKDGYRSSLITIWHKDPCSDGTDDSCGWFIRGRHCDQKVLDEIKQEFKFNLLHNYWFDKEGKQIFSTIGTLNLMYKSALWIHYKRDRQKLVNFLRKYTNEIITFAENPTDCIGDMITNKWNCKDNIERFDSLPGIIYSDILRKDRKWYQHPKWHIHHWRIQFTFITSLIYSFKCKYNLHETSNVKVCDDNLRETV